MQKWEYMVVRVVSAGTRTGWQVFAVNQIQVGTVTKGQYGLENESGEPLPAFLARAGEEGWELVAKDTSDLYFKRPKP